MTRKLPLKCSRVPPSVIRGTLLDRKTSAEDCMPSDKTLHGPSSTLVQTYPLNILLIDYDQAFYVQRHCEIVRHWIVTEEITDLLGQLYVLVPLLT